MASKYDTAVAEVARRWLERCAAVEAWRADGQWHTFTDSYVELAWGRPAVELRRCESRWLAAVDKARQLRHQLEKLPEAEVCNAAG